MSKKITAAITAIGGFVPEDKLTNFDLEKMVDTNDEWIRTRTGISERRILKGEGLATSDMVVPAVKEQGLHLSVFFFQKFRYGSLSIHHWCPPFFPNQNW